MVTAQWLAAYPIPAYPVLFSVPTYMQRGAILLRTTQQLQKKAHFRSYLTTGSKGRGGGGGYESRRTQALQMTTRPLESCEAADLLRWYDSVDAFLLDCDGVLWRSTHTVEGVDRTIATLRADGKRVYFVTNNSTKSRMEYVNKLELTCGIPASAADIISSAFAAAMYCKAIGLSKKVYVVGQAGLAEELRSVGLTVLGLEDFDKDFQFGGMRPTDLDPDVEAVVVGFDGRASYYKLNMAAAYLRYGTQCRFIATNRDATFPDSHMLLAGGGTLVAAVETAAGRSPDVVAGKPSPALLDIIEQADGLCRARTCMVGDRLDTDIAFGNGGGLGSTLLVLTGVTHPSDLDSIKDEAMRPTFVLDSFGALPVLLAKARAAVQRGQCA